MFKRILVPLDGSRLAEHAIPVAARLARAGESTVILLRAVRAPIEFEQALRATPAWIPAADPQEREEATRYLAEIQARDELSAIATERHIDAGAAAPLIRAVAQSRGADLIVMSRRGYSGLTRRVLGSVTAEVARTASTPVLVLPSGETPLAALGLSPMEAGEVPTISALIALDGSPLAEAALEPVLQMVTALARPAGRANLHLLRVVALGRSPGVSAFRTSIPDTMQRLNETRAQETHEAETYLSDLATRLGSTEARVLNLSVTWSVARANNIASAIIRTSEGQSDATGEGAAPSGKRYDLIALATHGRGGLQRWLMGSVMESVLQQAQVAVLSVRPPGVPAPPEATTASGTTAKS